VPSSGSVVGFVKSYSLGSMLVATRVDGVVHYHAGDHLGSTSVSVDALTSVVASSSFMPFGSLRSGGPVGTERTFTGQVDDAGTGLMFYNARYYDPVVGRFTQADSVLDGTNRYAYVRNNPTRFTIRRVIA
jgi:RHS repeat-associated protein